MPKFLLDWLALGIIFDLLFALQIYLMKSGKAGKQLQANYGRVNRFASDRDAFILPAAIGFAFWPYMLAGLIYFCVRVKQERDKQRAWGRLPPRRSTRQLLNRRGGN